jgi:outer membrane immunogenic protein
MRRELLASVSAIALVIAGASAVTLFSDPADAADLRAPVRAAPPPIAAPVYSWTGCYVGAHVGWGWGHANHSQGSFTSGVTTASSGLNTNGGLFGGQVGCNYQFAGWSPWSGSNWVVGVQGDFAGTDINGKGNDEFNRGGPFGDFSPFAGDSIALKTEWLASVTGRLGVTAWNNQALFYVKGGGAWIRNQWDATHTGLVFNGDSQIGLFSENRSGWTVGGGVEWTLWSPNWTAFVEYNFYRFDDGTTQTSGCFEVDTCTFRTGKLEINTVKVGVNYKFNWFGGGY